MDAKERRRVIVSKEEMERFVKERGWHTWYHHDYWVNPNAIEDPKRQDYTAYGMGLEYAYRFETENWPKFKCTGLPVMGMLLHAAELAGRK